MILFVFITPTVIELYKSIEKHQHNSCTETTTHFHQEFDLCSLCDFSLSNFALYLDSELYNVNSIFSKKNPSIYLDSFFLSPNQNYYTRGPPSFS